MLAGLAAPLTGAKFILRNKKLIPYLALPFALNALIFSLFLYFAVAWLPEIIRSFLPQSDGNLIQIAAYTLIALSLILVLLASVCCFSIVGNILAAPFTDLLTLRVEEMLLGVSSAGEGFSLEDLKKILRGMKEEMKRLGFVLLICVVLLPLNLIPVAGQLLYLALDGLVLGTLLGLEFFNYSLDRRGYTFRQKLRFIRERFSIVL